MKFRERASQEKLNASDHSNRNFIFPSANELAIILANRSAALYHMGRNELSLRDIKRALELGYPTEMEYKLRERQARCHLANKNAYEAMEAFK